MNHLLKAVSRSVIILLESRITELEETITALEAENRALKVRNEWLETFTVTPRVQS